MIEFRWEQFAGDERIERVTPFGARRITHAFHDIDGTHSRIREWVPVMTLCTGYVASYGCPAEPGEPLALAEAMAAHSPEEFPEGLRFSIESAGLSALTQMEWAIRRAVQNGAMTLPGVEAAVNDEIVRRIWAGGEQFDDLPEPPQLRARIAELSSALFRAYEILLLRMGRDRNLAAARRDPTAWRVPGSLEWLAWLKAHGVRNYFVTGAVVETDADGVAQGTMAEEVRALGYGIGPDGIVAELVGSTWREKLPKETLMERLCRREGVDPAQVLVTGDGRSEVAAGVRLGALVFSRLAPDAVRAREIHRSLHTNIIVPDWRVMPRE
jgi:phosphoglycolate phosphatase-like HAD superfamily hydrolase